MTHHSAPSVIAAVGNWLINFALGLLVPPGFRNITWKIFIIFGVLCLGAATQCYFTYPETAGKTVEEIEVVFGKEGPHPWKAKPGDSRLDAEIAHVVEAKRNMSTSEHVEHVQGEKRESADNKV